MTDLVTRAQLVMLAQTLDVAPEDVQFIDKLDAKTICDIRERMSALLFDEQEALFKRMVKLAPLVPSVIAAKVAVMAVPPLVAGRVSGALGIAHPDKAVSTLAHVPSDYLASAAAYVDPRAVAVLAPIVPVEALVPAAQEIVRRRDYITAARFLDYATQELVEAVERAVSDDVGLLWIASYTHSAERLSEIIRWLPIDRAKRIVVCSTETTELRLAGLSILHRLDADLISALGGHLFETFDDAQVEDVLDTFFDSGVLHEMLIVAEFLPSAALDRIAASPAVQSDERRAALKAAAEEGDHQAGLDQILSRLTD